MRSFRGYRSIKSTIGLLITFTLIGSFILFLNPLIKSNVDPYEIGWNKIDSDFLKKKNKDKRPYLWVMTTKSHPQGRRILKAYIHSKSLQKEITTRTIPIWTDLLSEEEVGHFFLPIRRNFIPLDPLCQVWMFDSEGKIISTWIINKSTTESIELAFNEWVKRNTSIKTKNLNLLHEQDVKLVQQKTPISLSFLNQQHKNVTQLLSQFDTLERIPISACFYGLEIGLDNLVKNTVKKFFSTSLYNSLDHVFRNGYKWNFLWKKHLVDFSTYSEQNAEIYLLLCNIHQRFPKEGYDFLAKTLLMGMKKNLWQKDGFIDVREGMEDDCGRSPYESFSFRELFQHFSLEEQKKLHKAWNLFEPSNFQEIPIQKNFEYSSSSFYYSLKKIHPYPVFPYTPKNNVKQLRIFSCLLKGSYILKDNEAQKWCFENSQKYLNLNISNQNLKNYFGTFHSSSQLNNLLSLADLYLQFFKTTKNEKWLSKGLEKIREIYNNLNLPVSVNKSPFLIPKYISTQNIFGESNSNKLIKLLWNYGAKEKSMFPVKQFLVDSLLLQNSVLARINEDNYFYLLEHIIRYQGKNSFKYQVKKELLKNINSSYF